ncbi:MAG TPA: hypothetical protein VGY58_01240 [Gemmataceae bacterium]|nr:hypothetical protein [Gemmataceae bacterium]
MTSPLATHDYVPGSLEAALVFLKRTRSELRTLHRVRVWKVHWHKRAKGDIVIIEGLGNDQGFWAEPAVAADGAGITVCRGMKPSLPGPLLNFIVRPSTR